MKDLNPDEAYIGWCSTKRDINGIHIRGPIVDPWVGITHKFRHWINQTQYFDFSEMLDFVEKHVHSDEIFIHILFYHFISFSFFEKRFMKINCVFIIYSHG